MQKKQPTKRSIPMIIAAIGLILYLWYTMPKTVEQLYPHLDLSECTGVTIWVPSGEPPVMTGAEPLSAEKAHK